MRKLMPVLLVAGALAAALPAASATLKRFA